MKKTCLFFAAFLLLSSCIFASASEYTTIEELNGKNIGVQTAVLYEELIQDRVPDAVFQYYTMPNDMILALQSGKVDAYLIEEVSYGVQKKNHPDLAVLDEPAGYINATCIIGNNERQDRLLSELNQFIADSWDNGLLDELYDYWIADFDPVNDKCDITGFSGENGVISVAVEGGYEPFSFISNGNISGFDVDFICRFARAYGYTPEFYEVPFEAIAPGVESGKYDIGMNIVVSAERNETGTLSDVYYTTPIRLVIMGEDESELTFFQQLAESFNKTFMREGRWKLFVEGAGITILITVTSIIAGTVLGFIIYMLCRKGNVLMNKGTNVFLWLIHGMPTVLIILPQAAQHFLPIYRNDVVTLIKETSVVGYIAVLDLTKISDLVRSRTYEAFFPLIVTAIMYFIISAVLTKLVTIVEHSIDPKRRKKDKILKGIKEKD